jgi:cobalt-zinc-cadmium efflux system outer membrane protein
MKKIRVVILLGMVILARDVSAQVAPYTNIQGISYRDFIHQIGKGNLEYAAEKFNMRIAEAEAESAKVFPDPELTLGMEDNGHRVMKLGYGFQTALSWTLELGGKRRARIDLAHSQQLLTGALLADYYQQLRADAVLIFLESSKHSAHVQLLNDSYLDMKKIADVDSIRFKVGEITAVDAKQSRLEASSLRNEVYEAEHDWQKSLIQLTTLMGEDSRSVQYMPDYQLQFIQVIVDLDTLLTTALQNRFDLLAAMKSKDVSAGMLRLAKANRAIDLGINVGVSTTSLVSNQVAPTPSMNTFALGITMPIKFSNTNKGELRIAQFGAEQADIQHKQIELEIREQVMVAWGRYNSSLMQVRQFDSEMLQDAAFIVKGKVYSYQRGETTLLEVLEAQRSNNELSARYLEALYAYLAAIVELQRVSGTWNLDF